MSLFLSFFFGDPSKGLSIRLRDGDADPITRWIEGLQEAARTWALDHDDIFLQSDLGTEPQLGLEAVALADYLFADRSFNGLRLGRHLQDLLEMGTIHTFLLRPGAPAEPVCSRPFTTAYRWPGDPASTWTLGQKTQR